jgi:hypothetical protein
MQPFSVVSQPGGQTATVAYSGGQDDSVWLTQLRPMSSNPGGQQSAMALPVINDVANKKMTSFTICISRNQSGIRSSTHHNLELLENYH